MTDEENQQDKWAAKLGQFGLWLVFVALIGVGAYILFGIFGDRFDWMDNPYIRYPFFILALFTCSSRENFFIGASALFLEIIVYTVLSTSGMLETRPILSYFLMAVMLLPGAMIGAYVNKKFAD